MILLILSGEVSISPYVSPYIEILERYGILYKIVAWHPRDNSGLYVNPVGTIEFFSKKRSGKKIRKIFNYLNYRNFVLKQIKDLNPEKIVFFTTPSVFLLPCRILKKYKNKYIFDYRDATYEFHRFYLKKVRFIAKNANFTSISSEGFRKIFDESYNIINCHNTYTYKVLNYDEYRAGDRLIVLYFGIVRDLSGVLGLFDNDKRFLYYVYGKMDVKTEMIFNQYISENKVDNIKYMGSYSKDKIGEIIKKSDAIVYYYRKSFNFDLALGNRYYDSLKYRKPMIVNPNIYCGELVVKEDVGIGYDVSDKMTSKNQIYNYLKSYNKISFKQRCETILKKVEKENEEWTKAIINFLVK